MFEAIFKLGWIRIREKSNSIWTVELWKFENQTENNIKIWWNRVRKKGGKFNSEILKINFLSDNTQKKISFEEF